MWVRGAAIRPVPGFALVAERVFESVEDELAGEDDDARDRLSEAFNRFEAAQPVLAARVADELDKPLDDTALALGYFLTLAVWMAFETSFKHVMRQVDQTALDGVIQALDLDEQLRRGDPTEAVESDDVVAMEQPHVLAFVHEHVDAALEADANVVEVDDVHRIYRLVLIETLALSYSVEPPQNYPTHATTAELLA